MESRKIDLLFRFFQPQQVTKDAALIGYVQRITQKLVSALLIAVKLIHNLKVSILVVNLMDQTAY